MTKNCRQAQLQAGRAQQGMQSPVTETYVYVQ